MDIASLKGYPARYSSRDDGHGHLLGTQKYSFRTKTNKFYIVNVEEYPHNLYVVKFHLKDHTDSVWRYHNLTHEYDARKIIYTCIEIGLKIYEKNPLASFGFIGCPTQKEAKTTKLLHTKRFKVYRNFATFFFSPDNFEHSFVTEKSSYLLLNRESKKKNPNIHSDISKMITECWDLDHLFMPETKKKRKRFRALDMQ